MTDIGTSLVTAFDYVWDRFTDRITDLTDEEYFWAPAPGGWSIVRDDTGAWQLEGTGPNEPTPDPAPVTTIAWRVGHVGGLVLAGFGARRFGSAPGPALPDAAAAVLPFLESSYAAWRDPMTTLTDPEWWAPLGPDWGPYAEDSTADLALHVFDELVHHGAEIGLLRDLYRTR